MGWKLGPHLRWHQIKLSTQILFRIKILENILPEEISVQIVWNFVEEVFVHWKESAINIRTRGKFIYQNHCCMTQDWVLTNVNHFPGPRRVDQPQPNSKSPAITFCRSLLLSSDQSWYPDKLLVNSPKSAPREIRKMRHSDLLSIKNIFNKQVLSPY